MRVSWHLNLVVAALAALVLVSGCGDSNDTNITIGEGTSTPGAHTPTPAKTSTAAAKTSTPGAVATPTAGAATATSGAATATVAGGPTPTATSTPGGSSVDADVQSITSDLLPFLSGTSLLTGGSTSALVADGAFASVVHGAEAAKTDPCPDGGTRVEDQGVPVDTITLTACKVSQASLGHFQFDGTIVITLNPFGASSIQFTFTSIDIDHNNHQVQFAGTLVLTLSSGNFVLNGPLTLMTPEGNFTLNATNVTIDSNRHLVSGSGSISDDSNNFDVDTVAMTVAQGGATATFNVTFDDQSVHTYSLNLTTGELTQTS